MLRKLLWLSLLFLQACTTSQDIKQPSLKDAAYYNVQLGLAYLQSGDILRAKRKLLLAQQQAPNSEITLGAMGYFLENTGNDSDAAKAYRKAIHLNPQSGSAQNNYGAYLCRHGRYQESERYFLLAASNLNYLNTAQAYENAGLCMRFAKQEDKALNYFSHALSQDAQRSVALLNSSQIYFQQQNYIQAKSYLDRYLKVVTQPNRAALELALNLSKQLHDDVASEHYMLILQSRYPQARGLAPLNLGKKQLYY